ncbi:hypothetical protein M426DRAFT_323966 [Hypoxylon sp. CI-4A]|nr:hypothetical protein M426DRAFT_323966 [Hypoxylon sp. CI-4A]
MDMSSMIMSMSSTATATSSMPMSTSMSMDMGGTNSCQISMLWNWNTIDSCFLASSWHITSSGMFAGSCIGVILLTMSLELLRRTVKEYDRYLVRKHNPIVVSVPVSTKDGNDDNKATATTSIPMTHGIAQPHTFRPSITEQAIRALLHMIQFAVAYFVMLLAMYFNGYIIICIFIGAYIGAFVFHWEHLGGG